MYTKTGKNHLNLHTAGRVSSAATHLVLGIDKLKFTPSPPDPDLTDRYVGAYESARVPIVNSTVLNNDIVFASSYDTATVPMFTSNVLGLVYVNDDNGNTQRVRKNVFNDFSDGGWSPTGVMDATTQPLVWPTADGGMMIKTNTMWPSLIGKFDLSAYQGSDYLTIPVFFGNQVPSDLAMLKVTFFYQHLTEGIRSYTLYDGLDVTGSGSAARMKFNNGVAAEDADSNGVPLTTNMSQPNVTIWQRRLDSGTEGTGTFSDFMAYSNQIAQVTIEWYNDESNTCNLYVGSPQMTPNYSSDVSNIVIAYGTLAPGLLPNGQPNPYRYVTHAGHSYMTIEYRIGGIQ